MDVRSLHHVAFAVEDLEQAVETYRRCFGAEVELRGRMEEQGVDAAYMSVGSSRIELMSPLGPDTPVGRFLARRGPGMHHVAYEVVVAAAVRALVAAGAQVIEPATRLGLAGHEVAFVHPDSLHGVLAEVVSSHG